MPYWGDSFINGFNAGQSIRERKQRREQEELDRKTKSQEAKAERDLRLKLAADSMKHDGDLLDKRLNAEAATLANGYNWRSQEAEKDRSWDVDRRRGDRLGRDLQLVPGVTPPEGSGVQAPPARVFTDKIADAMSSLKQTIAGGFKNGEPTAEVEAPFGDDGSGKVKAILPLSGVRDFMSRLKPAPLFGPNAEGKTVIEESTGQKFVIQNGQKIPIQ
jgi:hypothetical protein